MLALAFIVAIAIALRAYQADSLVVPAWVDGLHHTEITLKIMEEGRLPLTLRPFMPLDRFYYHFGFHVIAGLVASAGGLTAAGAVLALGQVLSALACLSTYALARAARIRPDACLLAAAVPASLYWFPMYFVAWSRFTQLAGLVVLPAAWVLLARAVRRPSPGTVVAAGITAGGLLLVHYRVLVFYAVGAVAMLVLLAAPRRNFGRRMGRGIVGVLAAAGVALALTSPWLAGNVAGGVRSLAGATANTQPDATSGRPDWRETSAPSSAESGPAEPPSGDPGEPSGQPWFQAAPGTLDVPRWLFVQRWNALLLAAAVAGLAWAALRRAISAWWLIATCLLSALVASPDLVRLPSSWLVPGFSAAISLWLPTGVGVAFLAAEIARAIAQRGYSRKRLGLALRAAAILATLLGVFELADGRPRVVRVLNSSTVITQAADMVAARWITEYTPGAARFLVSTGHWHLGTYRGLDGGYWLPVTSGRTTTMPGGLYSFADPDEVRAITAFAKSMEAGDKLSDDQLAALMDESGAGYVYVGPAGAGVAGKLSAARLSKVPFFEEVYARSGVHIFARR
jgi:hypothetical protein